MQATLTFSAMNVKKIANSSFWWARNGLNNNIGKSIFASNPNKIKKVSE